jgi:radical SAM enzyme (TIGR01210 family)
MGSQNRQTMKKNATDTVRRQISYGNKKAGKTYEFNRLHDPSEPAQMWFQESSEGLILFVVFYTQACRWSRCLGCNLPSKVSQEHVGYKLIMQQVDNLFADPGVQKHRHRIRKVIVSNNGSVLDEDTFSSTALMYLIAKLNLNIPNMAMLCMESRPEYVDTAELEFISRALSEGDTPTQLEIAIGFEAFDDHIRNDIFDKGLTLKVFEGLAEKLAAYHFALKCYFMQKPVPGINDDQAVEDIRKAIEYLNRVSTDLGARINMHLNPTYVAAGTALENAFTTGDYHPPLLEDVARAALAARDKNLSLFIGLSDEGLAAPGGSFLTPANQWMVEPLETFNRTRDFTILETISQSKRPDESSWVPCEK